MVCELLVPTCTASLHSLRNGESEEAHAIGRPGWAPAKFISCACPARLPLQNKRLGAGVIDGRGIWADDGTALRLLGALRERLGADQPISVQVSPLHEPRQGSREPWEDGQVDSSFVLSSTWPTAASASATPRSSTCQCLLDVIFSVPALPACHPASACSADLHLPAARALRPVGRAGGLAAAGASAPAGVRCAEAGRGECLGAPARGGGLLICLRVRLWGHEALARVPAGRGRVGAGLWLLHDCVPGCLVASLLGARLPGHQLHLRTYLYLSCLLLTLHPAGREHRPGAGCCHPWQHPCPRPGLLHRRPV